MKDKPEKPEVDLPPPCRNCRSLHKKYDSPLCPPRRLRFWWLEMWRPFPILGRFVPAWECDLRKYETVEDIEREEKGAAP